MAASRWRYNRTVDEAHRPKGPRARAGGLLVRSIRNETIVYDRATHRAHCLNEVAGFVLDRCDGETTPQEIAHALHERQANFEPADAEALVEVALERLGAAHLIEDRSAADSTGASASRSRRETIHALGVACLTPLVLSLTAPAPAEAQTCRDRPCTTSRVCCPEAPCCRAQGQNPPTCRPGSLSNPNCLP